MSYFKINNFCEAVEVMMTSVVTCKFSSGCGDLTYKKLMPLRGSQSMHLFYEDAAVTILEVPGAFATCDSNRIWRSVERTSRPILELGSHWILQRIEKECFHFDDVQVSTMLPPIS
jgi:hypothetical protein